MLKSADELPEGVDLAVFTLPAAGVREAIEACARRKVGSAMIFAAGFAEVGDQATQDAVTATARAAGLAVVGPNCLGVTNNVDGMWLHMLYAREAKRGVEGGVAFVGQSGGLLGHFQRAADGLGLPLSYVISTGNEAGLEGHRFRRVPGRRPLHPRDRDSTASKSAGRRNSSPPAAAPARPASRSC